MDRPDAQRVSTTLEALIFSEALRPLMRDADPLGGYGVTYFAQLLATSLEGHD
jgi:hypothetical protein